MLKKLFSAAAVFAAVAAFATDYARIDLNFWCNGNLKVPKGSDGVQVTGRRNYSQKKYANICYYTITVNLEKADGFELEYEVADTGDKSVAKVIPSITPIRLPAGTGTADVECLSFEIDDENSPLTPCKITKWTSMLGGPGIQVSAGDKFVVKAKFKKTAN